LMTGPPCPILEDSTVPPVPSGHNYVRIESVDSLPFRHSARFHPILARLVSVVFAVWLFAAAEQVTAVRDVLCLNHKPKSNRSESVVRVATGPLLSFRVLCSLSPLVPLCIRLLIRRDLTAEPYNNVQCPVFGFGVLVSVSGVEVDEGGGWSIVHRGRGRGRGRAPWTWTLAVWRVAWSVEHGDEDEDGRW
jgi:hypothetical protein